ncbi:hypothetical protein Pan241w_50670 [Gimesia alba]|uniref:Uncharacterized protein n=1 Tax=Gimesia alba TaxID=2527973 RepID=A0A517RM52_9PLAN|nr:hypothetical protein [Gimesia alba]QDT44950.1 hypothetical protein Pan241w_50670 [Gimesia alba]
MSELESFNELDPWQILLNQSGFRSKGQIYEIAQKWDCDADDIIYIVRKQSLSYFSASTFEEIRESEEYRELQVTRAALADIYDAVRDLIWPKSRTPHSGKDGSWFNLRVGIQPRSKKIQWWSDIEPDLQPFYIVRDKIISTINQLIDGEKAPNGGIGF